MHASQFGRRLKRLRKQAGISGVDFARAIGVSPNHLSRVERGIKGLALQRLLAAADRLGISLDRLLSPSSRRQRRNS